MHAKEFVFKGFLGSSSSDKLAEEESRHVSQYILHNRGGPKKLQGLLPGRSGKNMADRITQLQDALNQVFFAFYKSFLLLIAIGIG